MADDETDEKLLVYFKKTPDKSGKDRSPEERLEDYKRVSEANEALASPVGASPDELVADMRFKAHFLMNKWFELHRDEIPEGYINDQLNPTFESYVDDKADELIKNALMIPLRIEVDECKDASEQRVIANALIHYYLLSAPEILAKEQARTGKTPRPANPAEGLNLCFEMLIENIERRWSRHRAYLKDQERTTLLPPDDDPDSYLD